MTTIANVLVGLIALVHIYILVLEMFLWDKPAGLRAFGQTREAAAASRVLAANQGLYNGFLAAGLVWGLSLGAGGTDIKVFFLCCVLVAGLYGAATASRRILFVQAVPAAIAPECRSGDRTIGHGLVGMSERAAAFGGTVEAGPSVGGGFRVHATVPHPVASVVEADS